MKAHGSFTLPAKPPFSEVFWGRVDRSGGNDECWPWVARLSNKGYGEIHRVSRDERAHRVAWELANQQTIPEGMAVLHSCDNPPCCNPRHLWLGTQLQNIADRVAKNRSDCLRGEAHWNAKLTAEDVAQMRKDRAAGATYAELMAKWSVSMRTIGYVVRGGLWKHVP
jgi:hypothetical protein